MSALVAELNALPSALVLRRLDAIDRRLANESDWSVKAFLTGTHVEVECQCDGGAALLVWHLTAAASPRRELAMKLDRVTGLMDDGEVEWEFSAERLNRAAVARLELLAQDHLTLDADAAESLGVVDHFEESARLARRQC